MTDLERFKNDYKPKEEYSFLLNQELDSPNLTACVFKKQLILDKKLNTEDLAYLAIYNVSDKYDNFVKILAPYIEKR